MIKAVSYERYNGGVKVKRLHGSSTVTRFYVYEDKDANDPSKWLKVEAKGTGPADRKKIAIALFQKNKEDPMRFPHSYAVPPSQAKFVF